MDDIKCKEIGDKKLKEIFGKEYIERNTKSAFWGCVECFEGIYQYFVGFKTASKLPGHKASKKGWAVYALMHIDMKTGAILDLEYMKE